jgi:3-oxoacyl-[acyl-carrier protein] reductase
MGQAFPVWKITISRIILAVDLKNKVALVLGSIKGIGKEIGLALAGAGVRPVLTYFDWTENLDRMKQDFSETGMDHLIFPINLLRTEKIEALIESIIDRFGRIDILINNIERGGWPVVHGPYTDQQWELEFNTTLKAKRWVFEACLPHLKKTGNGVVINFSSIAGMVGRSGPASPIFNDGYATANRGISLLTETWARMGAPEVRVNEIMLGIFETRHGPRTRGWDLLSDDEKKAVLDHTLLSRIGTINDIIRLVLYMIKDAPYMTGSIVRLDGGYCIGGDRVGPMPPGVL